MKEKKNPICNCSRSNQVPWTDQITGSLLTYAPISELPSDISTKGRKAIFVHLFAILHKHWLICINYFIVCIKLFVYLIGIMKFMDKGAKDWLHNTHCMSKKPCPLNPHIHGLFFYTHISETKIFWVKGKKNMKGEGVGVRRTAPTPPMD